MAEATDPNKPLAPFKFDAAAYAATRTMGEVPEIAPLGEDPLIAQSRGQISQFIDGKLPDSVAQDISRRAAETAQIGGIAGPASRSLQLRDLGVGALDAMTKGIEFASGLEDLRIKREALNQNSRLETAKLREEARQANDRFALSVTESGQNQQKIQLAALDLMSTNRRFRIGAENDLIIANSQEAIAGVQQNVDSLGPAFKSFDDMARQIAALGI